MPAFYSNLADTFDYARLSLKPNLGRWLFFR